MDPLALHEFHHGLNAQFTELNGKEVVHNYGDVLAEYRALRQSAGVIDLSFRSRLCVLGADRQKFINGQVTNNVQALKTGEGCYAALVTNKGKLQSDLNIYALANEMLLDFEPGLTDAVKERLEKYVIADDAQMSDVASHYGLLSVQGPRSAAVVFALQLGLVVPEKQFAISSVVDANLGEIYLVNNSRLGTDGYDLFVPTDALEIVANKAIAAAGRVRQLLESGGFVEGRACGWRAFEIARIEAGIPRFGVDMDETNLAPEAIETRAISYSKGCYIGQEVIARIRTYGKVAKSLRGLRLADGLKTLPSHGDKLFKDDKEVGYITSSTHSPTLNANIALGYVRKEINKMGEELTLRISEHDSTAMIVDLPFVSGMFDVVLKQLAERRIAAWVQAPRQLVVSTSFPNLPTQNSFWITELDKQWYLSTWLPAVYRLTGALDICEVCDSVLRSSSTAIYTVDDANITKFGLIRLSEVETKVFLESFSTVK